MFLKKILILPATLLLVSSLSACSGNDYLADVTKDSHSGCFSASTNYLGFTENITYVHLGDSQAAVNSSPGCSGVTNTTVPTTIPVQPAPVGKTTSP